MAGDWIKMRCALRDDPAVVAMALKLNLECWMVNGGLHDLWSWADQQTTDGFIPMVPAGAIDKRLNCPGFAAAMEAVGWLVVTDEGILFPDFGTHNGQTAKQRATNTQRQARRRDRVEQKHRTGPSPEIMESPSTTSAPDTERDSCRASGATAGATTVTAGARPTEEKRTEEKEPVTGSPASSKSFKGSVFDDLSLSDLKDTPKLQAWFRRARAREPSFAPEDRWLSVRAAAFQAIAKGTDPLAYFRQLVGGGHWEWVPDAMLDRARESLRQQKIFEETRQARFKAASRRSRDRPGAAEQSATGTGEPMSIGEVLKFG